MKQYVLVEIDVTDGNDDLFRSVVSAALARVDQLRCYVPSGWMTQQALEAHLSDDWTLLR